MLDTRAKLVGRLQVFRESLFPTHLLLERSNERNDRARLALDTLDRFWESRESTLYGVPASCGRNFGAYDVLGELVKIATLKNALVFWQDSG